MILLILNNQNALDAGLEEIRKRIIIRICGYVLMYIDLPTIAFLSWNECVHNKKNLIFHLETRGKSKFKMLVVCRVRLATREVATVEFLLDSNFPYIMKYSSHSVAHGTNLGWESTNPS
jgi:hypothetical protein